MAPETARALIRPATVADLDGVVAIERISFSDPPWSRASFASLLGDPHAQFLVAILDGETRQRLGGYVVTWTVADEGDLSNLAVAPEIRHRGLGRRLLEAAITNARRSHVRSLYLEVRESNAIALRLYASRGFVHVGRRRRYYRQPVEDALILCLDVSAEPGTEAPVMP
jgi:[ribosomal protein S18]-alanine N-acetyltransferase